MAHRILRNRNTLPERWGSSIDTAILERRPAGAAQRLTSTTYKPMAKVSGTQTTFIYFSIVHRNTIPIEEARNQERAWHSRSGVFV